MKLANMAMFKTIEQWLREDCSADDKLIVNKSETGMIILKNERTQQMIVACDISKESVEKK